MECRSHFIPFEQPLHPSSSKPLQSQCACGYYYYLLLIQHFVGSKGPTMRRMLFRCTETLAFAKPVLIGVHHFFALKNSYRLDSFKCSPRIILIGSALQLIHIIQSLDKASLIDALFANQMNITRKKRNYQTPDTQLAADETMALWKVVQNNTN